MGKDSLLKSTSKKKGAGKKKGAEKRMEMPAPPRPLSVKELLLLKFDRYTPARPFALPPEEADPQRFAAPPFISAADPGDAARLKALLLERLDLPAMAAAAREAALSAPAAAAEPPPEAPPAPEETPLPESVAEALPIAAAEPEAEAAPTTLAGPEGAAPAPAPDLEAPAEPPPAAGAPAPEPAPEEPHAEPQPEPAAARAGETAPPGPVAPMPPAQGPPPDPDVLEGFGGPMPYSKTTILGIVAFVMLVLLIVGASYSNTHKFYLKPKDGALEIWRGAFAPLGEERLVVLPGVAAPEPVRDVYSRGDIYPLAFDYYVGQADALLDAKGLPDFEAIKELLHRAREFAVSEDSQKLVRMRIDYIDLFILRYKAEVAAGKGTAEDLDAAVGYLQEAERLAAGADETEEIAKRIETFKKMKAQVLEAAAAAEARAAEEKAAAEAEQAAAKEAAKEAAPAAAKEAAGEPAGSGDPPQGQTAEAPAEEVKAAKGH